MELNPGHLHILACGPYFDPGGLAATFFVFLFFKPLSYYLYVRAFRYRVCRPVPMKAAQAFSLAALRAVLGLVMVGACYVALTTFQFGVIPSWIMLYVTRVIAWWIVGKYADLRGWRMLGWIIGGEAINAAFDFAIVLGLAQGILPAVLAFAAVGAFIAILEWRGRRPDLLNRFSTTNCRSCGYNLTGNLSGICPECGTPIIFAPVSA